MTDYIIPCETVARMHAMAMRDDAIFGTVRIDNGCAVATDRRFMAVERLAKPSPGVFHLVVSPALAAQCETETAWKSDLFVTDVPELQFATCKTTLGWTQPTNCGLYLPSYDKFDMWREVVNAARNTDPTEAAPLVANADQLSDMAKCSPSGCVVFEETMNVNRPSVIRDCFDPNWFAVFIPNLTDKNFKAATLPEWFK